MTLEERLEQATDKRNAAERFSTEWFQAKAEVEDLLAAISARDFAARQPEVTDEQLAVMDYVFSDEYDD